MSAPVPLLPPIATLALARPPRTPFYLTIVHELHPSSTRPPLEIISKVDPSGVCSKPATPREQRATTPGNSNPDEIQPPPVKSAPQPVYTFSLDRIHTTLAAANTRLTLLSRSNTDPEDEETLRAGIDVSTGGYWVTWTPRPTTGAEDPQAQPLPRFVAEVRKVVMHGEILTLGPIPTDLPPTKEMVGGTTLSECRYLFERRKDLAGYVWVVAVHFPRQESGSADADGKPTAMPWNVESVHPVSGNALARAKRLWTENMEPEFGRFDRVDFHFGAARYILLPGSSTAKYSRVIPASANFGKRQGLRLEREPQIRVERLRVMREGELVAWFAPAEALPRQKEWRPLHPSRDPAISPVKTIGTGLVGSNVGLKALEEELERLLEIDSDDWEDDGEGDAVTVRSLGEIERKAKEQREDGEDWGSVLERGDFAPPADYMQRDSGFRSGVVGEYSRMAAELRHGQQARLEDIVNKANTSRPWSPKTQPIGVAAKSGKSESGEKDAQEL